MKTNFTKEEIIEIISEYYQKSLNTEVIVKIIPKVCALDMYENLGCYTSFEVTRKIVLGTKVKEFKENLDKEAIQNIFTAYFNNYGLEIESLEIDDALESRQTGYGLAEHTENVAVFKGINVILKKNKELKLVR